MPFSAYTLQRAADLTSHGMIVLRADGRVVFWNAWIVDKSGIHQSAAMGQTLQELFGSLPPRLQRAVDQALTQGQSSMLSSAFTPHPLPLMHPYDQKMKMTQSVVVKAFNDEQGQRCCLIDVSDVSMAHSREHKLREQSRVVRETLTRLSNVLDSVSEAIISTDANYRIQTINPVAEQLFSFKHDVAIGMPLSHLLPLLPEPVVDQICRTEYEGEFGAPDKRRTGVLSVAVTTRNGVEALTWVIKDITEAKRHESEMRTAREQAEAGSRQKSEFLANMSHEIRTPMNGVLGMADILIDTRLDEEQRDYVQTIRKSGESLLNILNDILDFSKIDAGKIDLVNQPFSLRELVEEVIGLMAARAHLKELGITFFLPHDLPQRLIGDPFRLRQILVNLISNSIKFTDDGHVVLRVFAEEATDKKTRLRFEVQDTGIGISEENIGHLFQPFTQVDGSSTRRFGGTGLGLVICRKLCTLMGGTIGVTSQPAIGSTFYVELALNEERIDKNQLPQLTRPVRVLLITHDHYSREFMEHQLGYWKIEPRVADFASGWQDKIDEVDLLFIDAHPAMVKRISAEGGLRGAARVIVLTSQQERARANLERRFQIFAKPMRLSELHSILVKMGASTPSTPLPSGTDDAFLFQPKSPGHRILVVEDNIINQKVLGRMLEKLGCHVQIAGNGEEALMMVEEHDYQMIVMDCQMPRMDGYEATGHIREREKRTGTHTPIVAMTANAYTADREKCIAAGMDDYLCKPVKTSQIQEMLKKWILQDETSASSK